MKQYNGMFESSLKLQEAYNIPTPIYKLKKEKWVFVPEFLSVTPTQNISNHYFEDNEKFLKELEPFLEDVLLHTIKSAQI